MWFDPIANDTENALWLKQHDMGSKLNLLKSSSDMPVAKMSYNQIKWSGQFLW